MQSVLFFNNAVNQENRNGFKEWNVGVERSDSSMKRGVLLRHHDFGF